MTPTKILIGQIIVVVAIMLGGLWASTQWIAAMLAYQSQLGSPWFTLLSYPVYHPWQIFIWNYHYGPYAPQHFNKAFYLVYAGAFLGIGAAIAGSVWRARRTSEATTYGSAKWASNQDLKTSGLLSGKGVVLGMNEEGEYLRHDGPEHVMVMAPTRSGKGVGIVVPTLLIWPGSVLVHDIKGENWELTAGYRSNFSNCIYFNPTDPNSSHFNPLLEVRRGELEVKDVQNIADMVVDPDGKGLADHWAKTGHALLVGTILHILYAEPDKTLRGVANFLSNPGRPFVNTLEAMMCARHTDAGTHPVVAAAAREMLNKSENERSGVLSTAMSFLSLYRDPIVATNTENSDFRLVDLMQAENPVSLYLVVPPSDIARTRPLIRLILNQLCRRLTEELNPTDNRHRLLLLIDEFPVLGRLDFFETALAYIAGYGIKAMLIAQSKNQLDKAYGPSNSILDNTHIRVVFAPNTIETAKVISDMLGTKTEIHQQKNYAGHRLSPWLGHVMVADQETARPLMTPGEVMELPSTDALIFLAGKPPIRAKKVTYYNDGNFKCRILSSPQLSGIRPYPYRPKPRPFEWSGVSPGLVTTLGNIPGTVDDAQEIAQRYGHNPDMDSDVVDIVGTDMEVGVEDLIEVTRLQTVSQNNDKGEERGFAL